ncbi:MAG: phosphatidylglycerol lysyltransferase domain-containing protein [Clostridiales bacterium]
MIDFKKVNIDDKNVFERYYKSYDPDVSEMTFTNVFMWREAYGYKYTIKNDLLCCVALSSYIKPFALTPIGNCDDESFINSVLELKNYFEEKDFKLIFKRVSKRGVQKFKRLFGENQIDVEFNRDHSDYVYSIEALSTLKGKKYHKKRNHINKFMKLYGDSYEYVKLEGKYLDDCYKILEDWCDKRNCEDHNVYGCEKLANIEVLSNLHELNCKGALIKVNGKFEAVTVAEKLSNDTIVIHIEKANSDIDGIYTLINRDFLANEWLEYKYVNREQDLGIEGLRKAKSSYNPDIMVDKYTVTIL